MLSCMDLVLYMITERREFDLIVGEIIIPRIFGLCYTDRVSEVSLLVPCCMVFPDMVEVLDLVLDY